jgi:2-iminoacetate synthase
MDYNWHTTAMDRAMKAGIDDVGIGVLYGLYDYKYETVAMFLHAQHLEDTFGVGPHTISVPRMRTASNVDLNDFPHLITDEQFKSIVAIIRLAVPYTGLILSTRETAETRDDLIKYGVSQLSAGSCTGVGGYQLVHAEGGCDEEELAKGIQFKTTDNRTIDEMVAMLCKQGFVPSFCTACYRQGRTGDRFMSLAKTGEIQKVCLPNALLTFKEYLVDYASPATKILGDKTIQNHLTTIDEAGLRAETAKRLADIEHGIRDLFF